LLEAQAEIAGVAGDIGTAVAAAEHLTTIADHYGGSGLQAASSLATARAELSAGQPSSAIASALQAVIGWTELGAPFEVAVARMVLGEAYAAVGATERGRMEWTASLDAFDQFGARLHSERVRRLLNDAAPARGRQVRGATVAVFARDGLQRRVGYLGTDLTVPDLKGYRYLERLLASPDREWHVLDLVAAERGSPSGPVEAGMPVLDDGAREAYRRRLTEVEQDIDEATLLNDVGRVELAVRDRDYLVAELSAAFGLGGRGRRVHGSSERARTSVARSLRYAVARLSEHSADLAAHLRGSLKTGTYCSYCSDPLAAIEWWVRDTDA
jgi:hypothetical protein